MNKAYVRILYMLNKITDKNFDELSKNKVIVLFTSPWCSGCRKVEPFLKELSVKHPDIVFGELDISSNSITPARLGVLTLPTVVAYKDGSEFERIAGEPSRHELEHLIRDMA
jgi:thiol-disulfide isomerase/thioredoxin